MRRKAPYVITAIMNAIISFLLGAQSLPMPSNSGTICYGYAQARAFGFTNGEAENIFIETVYFSYFRYTSGLPLQDILEGDIVVWQETGYELDEEHGHAAYVSYSPVKKPIGSYGVNPDGDGSDVNGEVPMDSVKIDHVLGFGQKPAVQGANLRAIHEARSLNGETFRGVFRPIGHRLIVRNDFGGGQIYVGKVAGTQDYINTSSPDTSHPIFGSKVPVAVVDSQSFGGKKRIFAYRWRKDGTIVGQSKSYTVTVDGSDREYRADFDSAVSSSYVEFEIRSSGASIRGPIKIFGSDKWSKTPQFPVGTAAEAYQSLMVDKVLYTFNRWEDSSGTPVSSALGFTPQSAGRYVASYTFNYIAPPDEINPFNRPVGDPICITWLRHSNSYVDQIQVWRKVKYVHAAMVIATLGGKDTTYTDWETMLTSGYTADLVDYDVRVRYGPTQTYSEPNWMSLTGDFSNARVVSENGKISHGRLSTDDGVTENSLKVAAYPNPFNPSITLHYEIAVDSHVKVTVINLTGVIVAQWSIDEKAAGQHEVTWVAVSEANRALPSGTYIVKVEAVPKSGGHSVTQLHRVVLLK